MKELGLSKREAEVAIGVIISRLVRPTSELGTHHWLQTQSGIDELIGTDFSRLGLRSVYKAGDNLLKCKKSLEAHLRERERDLFQLEDTVILYDLTNTYFEGTSKGIAKAARGHSKEKRNDCPLVTLGLVLDKQGFPLRSELLPGNVSEPATLQQALALLSPSSKPIVVLDAGIASEANLIYLRDHGYSYIVAAKRRIRDFPEGLELDTVKEEGLLSAQAGQVKDEESGETILYCRSTQRREKEEAIRTLLQERLERDLKQASDALTKKGGTKSYPKAVERIGRLKEKHKRVASYYDIEVIPDEQGKQAIRVSWRPKASKLERRFQGAYYLRAHGLEWTSHELWSTYIMLTKVEEAFRCLKTDLGLRPIFHQIGRRVDGHLFITVLAYHLMQSVLYRLKIGGLSVRWDTLRHLMASQVRVTTAVRLESGGMVRVRTTTQPDPQQKQVYSLLGLNSKPGERLRLYT